MSFQCEDIYLAKCSRMYNFVFTGSVLLHVELERLVTFTLLLRAVLVSICRFAFVAFGKKSETSERLCQIRGVSEDIL